MARSLVDVVDPGPLFSDMRQAAWGTIQREHWNLPVENSCVSSLIKHRPHTGDGSEPFGVLGSHGEGISDLRMQIPSIALEVAWVEPALDAIVVEPVGQGHAHLKQRSLLVCDVGILVLHTAHKSR